MTNTFISLEEFKLRLSNHVFSFSIQHDMSSAYPSGPKEELLLKYVNAQYVEATKIYPDAYSGGDDYMIALAAAQAVAVKRIVNAEVRNIPSNYLEIKVFTSLDPQLQAFITKLHYHDWYHDYSDDNKVWRAGSESEKYINEALTKGGAEYKFWYDKFKPKIKKEETHA